MASEKARDREVKRFYQQWLDCSLGIGTPRNTTAEWALREDRHIPQSSTDKALTAFAQLGVLRLGAKRGIVALIGSTETYIIAEATKSLSLVSDSRHDSEDGLWFGNAIIPRSQDISYHALAPEPYTAYDDDGVSYTTPALVISDVTKDDKFKYEGLASHGVGFYCGVPIVSKSGYSIGVYTVIDYQPRKVLKATELRFLQDMAVTVVDHLTIIKNDAARNRGEKMVRGLGSFVEGLSNCSSHHTGDDCDVAKFPGLKHANEILMTAEEDKADKRKSIDSDAMDPLPDFKGMTISSADRWIPRSLQHGSNSGKSQLSTASPTTDSAAWLATREGRESHFTGGQTLTAEDLASEHRSHPLSPIHRLFSSQDAHSSIPTDIGKTYARAANILRECTASEGVMFFDASFIGQTPAANGQDEKQSGNSNRTSDDNLSGSGSSSDSIGMPTGPGKSLKHPPSSSHNFQEEYKGPEDRQNIIGNEKSRTGKKCQILGVSVKVSAVAIDKAAPQKMFSIAEQDLKRCIRRFPRGKIFCFGETGEITSSSDESNEARLSKFLPDHVKQHRGLRNRRNSEKVDKFMSQEVLEIIPGARNIIFLPLWDFGRERWSAGAFIWTSKAEQLINAQDDLSYLKAFSSSIMNEIARLDALAADQAKSSFLANISHELRSPLHGILGSVEFLQDTVVDAFQSGMLTAVEMCGKTLLDTVNHVLDHAKINHLSSKYSKRGRRARSGDTGEVSAARGLTSDFNLATIVEEVVEAVYAGQTFRSSGMLQDEAKPTFQRNNVALPTFFDSTMKKHIQQGSTNVSGKVHMILDIDREDNWNVTSQPGAIRRIVMNLVGNSLKYTDQGNIHVSLRRVKQNHLSNSHLRVYLSVADTGQGMSTDFVANHAFTPFSQENSFSTGTGLGLSIVQQIVNSFGGKIELQSEKGAGTEIKIWLTLPAANVLGSADDLTVNVQQRTQNLTLCILDPNFKSSESTKFSWAAAKDSSVEKSFADLASSWFGMHIIHSPSMENVAANFFVYTEAPPIEYLLHHHGENTARTAVPLIICCTNAFESAALEANGIHKLTELGQVVEINSQPLGPCKLARTLYRCLKRIGKIEGDMGKSSFTQPVPHHISDNPPTRHADDGENSAAEMTRFDESHKPITPDVGEAKQAELLFSVTSTRTTSGEYSGASAVTDQSDHSTDEAQSSKFPSQTSSKSDEACVLIVDDNTINLQLLIAFMKKAGCHYEAARDGLEAFKAYQSFVEKNNMAFRFILMDLSMPICDGLESTREIRKYEKRKNIQPPSIIIGLTAYVSEKREEEALSAGMDRFFTKPVRFKDLLKLISPGKQYYGKYRS